MRGSSTRSPWFLRGSLRPVARLLALPAARLAASLAAAFLLVALLAGALRVLPLVLAPGVPLRLVPPLARGVVGMALETALLVAPPIAWALLAARLVDRGEARALAAIGVSPLRLVLGTWPALLGVALAAALAARAWGSEAAAPGRMLHDLLVEARASCEASPPPAAVPVPLVGLSWVCLEGEPPRAVGVASFGDAGSAAAPAFAARGIALRDDLRGFAAEELTLFVPGDAAPGALRITVGNAVIHGIPPLGRASNLGPWARAWLVAGSAIGLSLLVFLLVLRRGVTGRVLAFALGVAGPGGALMAFSSLEREAHGAPLYALVPLAGALGIGLVLAATSLGDARRALAALSAGTSLAKAPPRSEAATPSPGDGPRSPPD